MNSCLFYKKERLDNEVNFSNINTSSGYALAQLIQIVDELLEYVEEESLRRRYKIIIEKTTDVIAESI